MMSPLWDWDADDAWDDGWPQMVPLEDVGDDDWPESENGDTDRRLAIARRAVRWIERHQRGHFTVRELFTALKDRATVRRVADLESPLEFLMAHHYVRTAPAYDEKPSGRPKGPCFDTHPELLLPLESRPSGPRHEPR
jgi:hypothetical protein